MPRGKESMRVAVAGTCGLALAIAREIEEETSHQVIILSRIYQPNLTARGYQCQVVDYANAATLQHSLMGVDTVISTVSGTAQLRLIEAAVAARVRRFAPAEFEGQPSLRSSDDPLDASKALARAHLQYYQSYIESTVFVCGILYERFSVGGMKAHRIGVNSGYGNEGDYIVNARSMKAEAPIYDAANNLSFVCMTSAYDVARFVVRALDMAQWPSEMSMCGERMSVNALVEAIKAYRGRACTDIKYQNPQGLRYQLARAQSAGDVHKQERLQPLLATAEGRYDFATPAYLNTCFPDIRPVAFRDWFLANWAAVP